MCVRRSRSHAREKGKVFACLPVCMYVCEEGVRLQLQTLQQSGAGACLRTRMRRKVHARCQGIVRGPALFYRFLVELDLLMLVVEWLRALLLPTALWALWVLPHTLVIGVVVCPPPCAVVPCMHAALHRSAHRACLAMVPSATNAGHLLRTAAAPISSWHQLRRRIDAWRSAWGLVMKAGAVLLVPTFVLELEHSFILLTDQCAHSLLMRPLYASIPGVPQAFKGRE